MNGIGPYSTHGTPGTEIDVFSIAPSAAKTIGIYALRGQGRGSNLTQLIGIELNWKLWTTASTGGNALTPSANDIRHAVAAGAAPRIGATASAGVTAGSGGGTYRSGIGFGGSGPGGWVAANPDAALQMFGGYAGSLDIYSVSGAASMLYSFWLEFTE